ncbi:hypothetical protein C8R44DRAFT_848414 [Mycena epipterygia]|nr:hypothetical protein C8R44DRAFT_848414 [Mycena epipterygia]
MADPQRASPRAMNDTRGAVCARRQYAGEHVVILRGALARGEEITAEVKEQWEEETHAHFYIRTRLGMSMARRRAVGAVKRVGARVRFGRMMLRSAEGMHYQSVMLQRDKLWTMLLPAALVIRVDDPKGQGSVWAPKWALMSRKRARWRQASEEHEKAVDSGSCASYFAETAETAAVLVGAYVSAYVTTERGVQKVSKSGCTSRELRVRGSRCK